MYFVATYRQLLSRNQITTGKMRQIVVLAILFNFALAVQKFNKHQVWRFVPKTDGELASLRNLQTDEVDFWQSPTGLNRPVDVRLSPAQIKQFEAVLKQNGLSHNVMIEDVQQLIDSQMKRSRSNNREFSSIHDFDYTVYHDLEDIEKWGDALVNEYSFATKFQIGVSFEGRPLNVIEIRKPRVGGAEKPLMYIDTLIHSREWVTGASFMFIFKEMLTNPTYAYLIDDYDWIYVPCVNVDGYATTWEEDRLWRKTRSTGSSSVCQGTDPNRNFDYHWSDPGASSNPCSETFYGPTPASENVIRHLQTYIWGLKDEIDSLLSIHSYSQLILYPYGYTADPPHNVEELDALGQNMSAAIKAVHGMDYVCGQSAVAIYVSSGGTKDWTHSVAGIDISYSFELRDTGEYGFLLPEDQIIPNGEEVMASIEVLAYYVSNKES